MADSTTAGHRSGHSSVVVAGLSEMKDSELPPPRRPRRAKKRKRPWHWLFVLLGVLLLLYPVIATIINDYEIEQIALKYGQETKNIQPSERIKKIFKEAESFNEYLDRSGHHYRQSNQRDPDFQRYMNTLHAEETGLLMARIVMPTLKINLPVYHTTNSDVLYRGAGHMYGSDLPIGGLGNNSVISAHTGMVDASMFDDLPQIKDGAEIFIDVFERKLVYRVVGRKVVRPNDYDAVTYEPGKDKLTLITCTPYGLNTDRLLVEAERVNPAPKESLKALEESGYKVRIAWWMYLDVAIIVGGVGLIVFLDLRQRRRSQRRSSQN